MAAALGGHCFFRPTWRWHFPGGSQRALWSCRTLAGGGWCAIWGRGPGKAALLMEEPWGSGREVMVAGIPDPEEGGA